MRTLILAIALFVLDSVGCANVHREMDGKHPGYYQVEWSNSLHEAVLVQENVKYETTIPEWCWEADSTPEPFKRTEGSPGFYVTTNYQCLWVPKPCPKCDKPASAGKANEENCLNLHGEWSCFTPSASAGNPRENRPHITVETSGPPCEPGTCD